MRSLGGDRLRGDMAGSWRIRIVCGSAFSGAEWLRWYDAILGNGIVDVDLDTKASMWRALHSGGLVETFERK